VRDNTEHERSLSWLQESERRFRELAELLPETIYEMELDGTLTFANRRALEVFGYTEDDLSRGLNAFTMISAEHRHRALQNAERIVAGEELKLNEYRMLRRDGTTFEALLHSSPIRRNGKPVGLRGFIIDITERKRTEARLHQAERMQALVTLAGGVAHDFNNLLMGIQGHLSLVSMELPDDASVRPDLEQIGAFVKSAARLTKQLLGLARTGNYEVEATNMGRLVRDTVAMFRRTHKHFDVHLEQEPTGCVAAVDATQIEQVVLNLLLNAAQAMQRPGRITVTVGSATRGDLPAGGDSSHGRYVRISVSDDGIGMDEVTLKHIFDPFFTTKGIGGGTGLGLASAYGIVESHGGHVDVSSAIGAGTRFDVYLPAAGGDRVAERDEPAVQRGSETLLIVDDEEMILRVARRLLGRLGYRVLTASSGSEAVRVLENEARRINLVIMDLVMPGMTAEEVYESMRAVDDSVPVLLMSGVSADGPAQDLLANGCVGFIQKPFVVGELTGLVRQMLDSHCAQAGHPGPQGPAAPARLSAVG
jgi:PAS domain S-box-containing protein